eukprot:359543-Chlamydomonas_euryale.AAC.11
MVLVWGMFAPFNACGRLRAAVLRAERTDWKYGTCIYACMLVRLPAHRASHVRLPDCMHACVRACVHACMCRGVPPHARAPMCVCMGTR